MAKRIRRNSKRIDVWCYRFAPYATDLKHESFAQYDCHDCSHHHDGSCPYESRNDDKLEATDRGLFSLEEEYWFDERGRKQVG